MDPPDTGGGAGLRISLAPSIAPMFPLPAVFLFPGQILPLHIFEPRYLQMVADCLGIVMATLREDAPPDPRYGPQVQPVGGIGEIGQHRKLEGGRYLIILLGLSRVAIEEVESDRMYRKARFVPLIETSPPEGESSALHSALELAIKARVGEQVPIPGNVSTGQLADILGQCLQLPAAVMASIYAEADVLARARKFLDAHRAYP
jgi:Lon protease-like protein